MTAGFTLELDDLEILDDHPGPGDLLLVTPDLVLPNTFINDMFITLTEDPLFADPDVHFNLGPGFLVQNLKVIDAFHATADVTVGPRATRTGHEARVSTPAKSVTTCDINVDRKGDPVFNTPPEVTFQCPQGVVAGQSFDVALLMNDADNDIVLAEAAIEHLGTEEILFDTISESYQTPQVVPFTFPGIGPGEYLFLAILDDGLVENGGTVCSCNFLVDAGPCPADLNADRMVNAADLALLLGGWGLCPGCLADLNGDGVINAADLALLLGGWGACASAECGNGIIEAGEQCDPPDGVTCGLDCQFILSDCCFDNGTPGCDDPECEALVCGIDSFCCDVNWDGICAEQAADFCEICAP